MSDKKPPVTVMLGGPATGAMAALSLAAASMETTQVLVASDSADQPAPTPRTEAAIAKDSHGDRHPSESKSELAKESRQLEHELSAAKAEAERLREALETAAKELGVPQPGYPAPVANAAEIIRAALAATRKDSNG